MFDKIEEILINLKERFSNPLISSFLISWPFCNWKITVPLLWGDKGAYKTYVELISDPNNMNYWTGLALPLTIALLYTFVYPFLKNSIRAFLSWTERWGLDWELDIKKEGSIPVRKYLDLKREQTDRIIELTATINEENTKVDNLSRNLEITGKELTDAKNTIKELQNRTNYYMINGIWNKTVTKKDEAEQDIIKKSTIEINNGGWSILNESNRKIFTGGIEAFQYIERDRQLFFVLILADIPAHRQDFPRLSFINRLIFSQDKNVMSGTEDEASVRYERQLN